MQRAAHLGGAAMFHLSANLAVYLHRGTIDFRKSINGLSAMVVRRRVARTGQQLERAERLR